MARRLLALTLLGTLTVEGWAPDARVVSQRAPVSRPVIRAAEAEDTPASPEGSELSAEFNKLITDEKMQDFNDELYAHLGKRPEFETSEVYKNLRKRVDVSDPLSSELDQIKAFRSGPTPEATPGDVIENVLRALRDVDSPSANAGLELLQQYSSPASALSQTEAEQLRAYFETSKYGILLEWVQIKYTRKLEVSLDKRRALQQLTLASSNEPGRSVPVTFQLSQYSAPEGDVWLIDQLLVKQKDL